MTPRKTIWELYEALSEEIGNCNLDVGRSPEFRLAQRAVRLAMLRYQDAPAEELEKAKRLLMDDAARLPRYSDRGLQ